jgi:hypothetical protein
MEHMNVTIPVMRVMEKMDFKEREWRGQNGFFWLTIDAIDWLFEMYPNDL